jgi:hypothetical protein
MVCILALAGCSRESQQVTIKLKNGDVYSGSLASKDASTVTVVTPAGEARTLLSRQIASIETHKAAEKKETHKAAEKKTSDGDVTGSKAPPPPTSTASAAPVSTSSPAATAAPAPALKFVMPASGRLSIPTGTVLTVRLREALYGGDPETAVGTLITATLLDSIQAGEASIPADSQMSLAVLSKPGSGGKQILCAFSSVIVDGHLLRPPSRSGSSAEPSPLGWLEGPASAKLPVALREGPARFPANSVVEFKLTENIPLREFH